MIILIKLFVGVLVLTKVLVPHKVYLVQASRGDSRKTWRTWLEVYLNSS